MKKPRTYKASLIHLKMVQAGVRNLSMVRTPDRRYVLASSDYILGPFARSLRGWLKRREVLDYVPEINDCDDFAQAAQTWARIGHNRTWREQWLDGTPAPALAVGQICRTPISKPSYSR